MIQKAMSLIKQSLEVNRCKWSAGVRTRVRHMCDNRQLAPYSTFVPRDILFQTNEIYEHKKIRVISFIYSEWKYPKSTCT